MLGNGKWSRGEGRQDKSLGGQHVGQQELKCGQAGRRRCSPPAPSPFTLTSCTTVCDGSVIDHRQTLTVTHYRAHQHLQDDDHSRAVCSGIRRQLKGGGAWGVRGGMERQLDGLRGQKQPSIGA
jgi:hypothetical protein